jgi:acyl-CoA synthetase (AMP-forming)/AMP-acid ligase II
MVFGDALRRCVGNHPDKPVLIDEYGKHFPAGQTYTYGAMFEAVNRLANSLLALGLDKGDRVAVQTGTGTGHILTLFALARAGMVAAPIDRTFTPGEVSFQLSDSGARGLVVDADLYREKLAAVVPTLPNLKVIVGIGADHRCPHDFDTLLREGSPEDPAVQVDEDDPLTLIYTSGTTGRPKGVLQTHRRWGLSALLWAAELGVHPLTRWLLVMPLHTSGGTGLTVAAITRGCTLVLTDPNPAKILELIPRERITFTQFSPTLLAKVIRHPAAKVTDFSSIERWFTSAAPISAELLKEGASYLGEKFTQLYGTTETALLGTVLRPEDVSQEGPLSRRLTSIGKACLGYEAKVVDDEGNLLGPGGRGELAIRGGGVGTGYWNRPDADDFRGGWWYSGDLVEIDEDGFYYVVDRKKDMIVTGGNNVAPREVEDVISSHPAVHLVSVIGVPDPTWGEAVKAVVVLKDGARATQEEIVSFCAGALAPYKRPKSVDFVALADMPLAGGGYKVLKRELRERYRNGRRSGELRDRLGARITRGSGI